MTDIRKIHQCPSGGEAVLTGLSEYGGDCCQEWRCEACGATGWVPNPIRIPVRDPMYEDRVEEILRYVLYKPSERVMAHGEIPRDAIMVEGIVSMYGFEPQRLEEKRGEVLELIETLVGDSFLIDIGGGASFVGLCRIRDTDTQWTRHTKIAEAFFLLATGLELAGLSAPYEMWGMFPEGIPYIWFRKSRDVEIATVPMPKEVQ